MIFNIKISDSLFQELESFLFREAPKENGCFVLGNRIGNNIIINEICYPGDNDILKEEDICSPSSQYIFRSAMKAKSSDKSIIFCHSHPNDWHPSQFSELDIQTNEKLFTNLSEFIPNPIGSIVLSKKGLTGIGYFQENYCEISKYSIVGQTLKIISNSSKSKENFDTRILKMYDRQLGFISEDDFVGIKNLHIAIVGCGGIGSPLAVMLAKMGVEKISLFDDDKIEIHNLPRIYGADESDIGKFKTEVLKNHINSFSNCEVITYNIRVDENIADFYNCDVIYGCLDNYQARSTLNRFSYTLATPYIDAGCAIPLDENTVINAATSVTVVMPTRACLWCAGIINGMKLREESLTTEEHSRQVDEGYIQGVNSVPSVISLTTAVASAAANRLFNILGIYNPKIPMRTVYDFNFDKKFDYHYDKKEKCLCSRSFI